MCAGYYWSAEWQEQEAAADRELAAGLGQRFESADEALAWLDSDDEDGVPPDAR